LTPCPFCNIEPGRIWLESEQAVAVPDAFPVAEGHMLIVPRKHVMTIYQLPPAEQSAIWKLVGEVRERLLTGLKPDGFNIGFNDGLATGQMTLQLTAYLIFDQPPCTSQFPERVEVAHQRHIRVYRVFAAATQPLVPFLARTE
jgi:hypothetical protein